MDWCFSADGLSFVVFEKPSFSKPPNAQIVVDFLLRNYPLDTTKESQNLSLIIQRISSICDAKAFSTLVDAYLHFRSEIESRISSNSSKFVSIKENTIRFLDSVNLKIAEENPTKSAKNYFENINVTLLINQLIVAMPFAFETNLEGELLKSPSLVLSIQSICYQTNSLLSNRVQVRDLCLQFISDFQERNALKLPSMNFISQNRFSLEDIAIEFQQSSYQNNTHDIEIYAGVKGFNLDIDSQLAAFVNIFVKATAVVKDKIESIIPLLFTQKSNGTPLLLESKKAVVLLSANFEFEVGQCRVNVPKASKYKFGGLVSKPSSSTSHDGRFRQRSNQSGQNSDLSTEYNDQIFYIPGISFWIEGCSSFGEDCSSSLEQNRFLNIVQIM
jgi:hypothetical protein